jgi:LacI family transcriptional regulator
LESVTIKDIAKALNLSTSTVSRALRDSYEINPETKKLVLAYAERVNYRPNPIALSLRENKSRSIGVLVPEIANNYFSQAINGIESVAYNRGYHVVIFQSHESYQREVVNVEHIVARKIDGLLISLSSETIDITHLHQIHEKGYPIVLFDRVHDQIETFKVVADNFEGAFKATEHLILTGRRKIAHLTSLPDVSIAKERLLGYKEALKKHKIPYNESLIRYCKFAVGEVESMVDDLLNQEPDIDAFFTGSDRIAVGCLETLKLRNISIPEDVSLIGFSNLRVLDLLSPPLSSIFQPAFEIGQMAAELLLDWLEQKHPVVQFKTVKLPTEMIIRASSNYQANEELLGV